MPIPDITDLSLRARLAIALRLLAGYCEQRRLVHPEIAAYLDHVWRFIGTSLAGDEFGQWEADAPPLVDAGLGGEYPPDFEAFLAACGVSEREFRRVLVAGRGRPRPAG